MANESIPLFEDGSSPTCVAGAAITGKRFVKVAGTRSADGLITVVPAAAGDKVFGVAYQDAAIGTRVVVWAEPGMIVPVKTGAVALTAGVEVQSDATGQAIVLAAGKSAGVVVEDSAIGADVMVALRQ
jgi:hypothetical protein